MALPALAAKFLRLNVLLLWSSSSELPPAHPEGETLNHCLHQWLYLDAAPWLHRGVLLVTRVLSLCGFACLSPLMDINIIHRIYH